MSMSGVCWSPSTETDNLNECDSVERNEVGDESEYKVGESADTQSCASSHSPLIELRRLQPLGNNTMERSLAALNTTSSYVNMTLFVALVMLCSILMKGRRMMSNMNQQSISPMCE
uniref:Uncharacterized protein n=1 Tax=Plectus sambesii TaxID=2011161 RepID=A0A914URW8_9BILA